MWCVSNSQEVRMSDTDTKPSLFPNWIYFILGLALLSIGVYFLKGTYNDGATLAYIIKVNWPCITLFVTSGFVFAVTFKFPTELLLDQESKEKIEKFHKSMSFLSKYKFPDNYTETISRMEKLVNNKDDHIKELEEKLSEKEAKISLFMNEIDGLKSDLQVERTTNPAFTGENICAKMKEVLKVSAQYHSKQFQKDQTDSLHSNQKSKIDTLNQFIKGELGKGKGKTPDYRVQQEMATIIWGMCSGTKDAVTWKKYDDDSCSSEAQLSKQKDVEKVDISPSFMGR